MISEKTIQEVFSTARIEDVAGEFLSLKRRGSNLVGLCPFHDEKTPSFMVSPGKNIYKCFGCGRGGGTVQFIMEHERYTFPEAIRYLAGKYSIEIEETEQTDEDRERMQEIESLYLINDFAWQFFARQLHDTEEGRAIGLTYFKERGYREGVIRKFHLGYSPERADAFQEAARTEGFSEERIRQLGLVNKSGRDFFRRRVIFPIHNLSGKVIGFGARTLKSSPREPKYINSPESPVYNKRKVLYGLHFAKNAIRKHDMCYLVEGYTDVLSLFQSGIENVVASSGTALTEDQIRNIKRFTHNITVLYDGDEAGVKAALRGLDLMLEQDILVRLVLLPDEHDPDSLVREKGNQAFRAFIESQAKDFIVFKAGFLSAESSQDPIQKSLVVRDIVQSLALVPDAIRRSMYIKECARLMDVDERLLVQETNSAIRSNLKQRSLRRRREEVRSDFAQNLTPVPSKESAHTTPDVNRYTDEYQERDIVRVLIHYGDRIYDKDNNITVSQYVLQNISDVRHTFDNPVYSRIIEIFEQGQQDQRAVTHQDLIQHSDPEISHTAIEILATPFEYSENWVKMKNLPLTSQKDPEHNYRRDSYESILRFKLKKLHHKIEENKQSIKKHDEDRNEEQRRVSLKVHERLLKIKSQLEEELNTVGIHL